MDLKNKTVLVTGASKGIGQATAVEFAKAGANVIVHYNSDQVGALETKKLVEDYGVKAFVVQANVIHEDQVIKMFQTISNQFKQLDVVVNNAGLTKEDDLFDTAVMQELFEINYIGPALIIKHALALLKNSDLGKIVFVSSINGRLSYGNESCSTYSALKAALDSYMKNMAKELAPQILVNSVAPGRTLTPQYGQMDDDTYESFAKDGLTNKWVQASEVGDAIVFLAKNDAMCGEVLTIDGGLSLKNFG